MVLWISDYITTMKLPAALYFAILFGALAASGATAGETEEVATAPLEPLSPDSFFEQPSGRALRGMMEDESDKKIIWGEESGDFRVSEEESGEKIIWEAEADDFRVSETAGGGVVMEEDAKMEEENVVTQVIPGCHQANKFWCGSVTSEALCNRVGPTRKYCKWCPTCKKCVNKCDGLLEKHCKREKHCKWV